MKTKQIIFLSIIVSFFCKVQAGEQYDVRNTHWGMTPDEAIKAEDNKFFIKHTVNEMPSGHIILASPLITIDGIDAILSYIFKDDSLISASYWFVPTNKFQFEYTKELFAGDFKTIQDFLEKQYGKPDKIVNEWQCLWIKEKTIIIHLIKEQYGSASHGIIYYDIDVWKSMGENTVLLNP
jgi:hypothetical protein